MVNIDKEIYENNGIESITDGNNTLWLNETHIKENLPAIANKYDQMYKKRRDELVNIPKKQSKRRFLLSDLALKIIMICKTDESYNFKRNLGFKLHDVTKTKE